MQRVLRKHICGIVFGTVFLFGCDAKRLPALIDTLGSATDQSGVLLDPDPRQFAPIIVVAKVVQNETVERRRPAARMPKVLLDLHKVQASLETTIRGRIGQRDFTFYYFVQDLYSPQPNPVYKRMFEANPGERYIFFLSVENGILRSIGDVGEYALHVASGLHPDDAPSSNLGIAVADILLKRGDRANSDSFAKGLHSARLLVDKWGSRLHNVQLLRTLVMEREPVRSTACYELVRYYNGQYDCLYRIRDDPGEPSQERTKASTLVAEESARDARLIELLKDPARLSYLPVIEMTDSRRRVFEELQTLLMATNPRVQKSACEALRRYYPYDAGCVRNE